MDIGLFLGKHKGDKRIGKIKRQQSYHSEVA